MRDKELKIEDVEASHTLGGAGEGRTYLIGSSCLFLFFIGTVITLMGSNLGPSKSMVFSKLGSTSAQISAFPTFDKILLTVPHGVGGSLDLNIILDGEMGISSKGFKFSYSVPHQTQAGGIFLWPPKGRGGFAVANAPATSSLSFTIAGNEFGTQDYTNKPRDGHTAAEASRWISDSIVVANSIGITIHTVFVRNSG
jgi:hypothetical protein